MPENDKNGLEEQIIENRAIKADRLKQPLNRKKRIRTASYIAIVVVSTLAFFIVALTVFFKIRTINITGLSKYTDEEILKYSGINIGESLFTFDADNAEQIIAENFPYVNSVAITRKIPSTVNIEVIEETPAFQVHINNDTYVISDNFTVLERIDGTNDIENLVLLDVGKADECIAGKKISYTESKLEGVIESLWEILTLYELSGDVDYIEATNRFEIYFGYKGRIRVYVGDIEECESKIRFFIKIMDYIYDDQIGSLDISDKKEATFSPDN